MKTITMIIGASKNHFGAYPEEDGIGIYGAGDTIKECKQSVLDCIEFIKEDPDFKTSEILKGQYEIVYKYDMESFLQHYKGILTNSALERLTGINQKQIQNYSSGHRKPTKKTTQKIENALHNLGQELLTLKFA